MRVHAEPAKGRLLTASFLGGPGSDTLRHTAFDPDGTLWVVGNSDAAPGNAALLPFPADPRSRYRQSFVARLSTRFDRAEAIAWSPPGGVELTTVLPDGKSVYVAGYATVALKPLAANGALPTPAADPGTFEPFTPAEHYSHPRFDPATAERGIPFVARLSRDLRSLDACTYLEGWQSRWHVPKPLGEDWTQRTLLGRLSGGDLVVVHDGGYNRIPDAGETAGLEHFYHAPDHVSRLSPDLRARRWTTEISMNPVDPAKAGRFLRAAPTAHALTRWAPADPEAPWPWSSLGNTHALDLAMGAGDTFHVAGYSSSRTAEEPWWAPFLISFTANGTQSGAAYTTDPMSGSDGRLDGQVSDSAIAAVGADPSGKILFSGIADGGNSVLRRNPFDAGRAAENIRGNPWGFRGRTLFWGIVGAIDPGTRSLAGGAALFGHVNAKLQPAWATAIAPMPGAACMVAGRNAGGFAEKPDLGKPGPGSFVRLYRPDFQPALTAAFPGVRLHHLAARGKRAAAVGDAAMPSAITASPLQSELRGPTDGYVVVIDLP